VAAEEFEDPDALASADEATKPIEASDNVSAINVFMIFPFLENSRAQPQRIHHVW
jgi:hypothetical protein